MSDITVTMPDGRTWVPKFVKTINQEKCIGCGRCFKVCGREVLQLVGIDHEGEIVSIASDEEDDDEYEKKVMTIANQMNCVGCEACSKICPKKCYTHEPMTA
ncbi:ferredoxin III, nif-specific [Ferrovum myxofaciens]|jgi:Nif-specific ferredoxin III|uniref:Ferredoxin III n=1 Tax=Ferrovum myxofaciens TaxID=416213 RepID=A0A8F3DX39_9PROT|nr:ferredoxin III, nif-specific [Ferrovum myxofaciens]KXW57195.1 ferredoxin-3 [Ferrovum myxofaciens]MBU6995667.1 ferredoxin III, nif-specific [Ferrovum myxofaciens]QKE39553.1 MAG: ferredoxin III, nif-specific [Ferrovum myxofaciens]QKE42150.1 MAG: ferredoxin III, nif-specific [Ferrovum myxofaciens]QWY74838.1 MAG: ferredoxin III, nif-specific [Ferrovum myxofaciens]